MVIGSEEEEEEEEAAGCEDDSGDGPSDESRGVRDEDQQQEEEREEERAYEDDGGDGPSDDDREAGNGGGGQDDNEEEDQWNNPPEIIDLDLSRLLHPAVRLPIELTYFAMGLMAEFPTEFEAMQAMGAAEYRFRLGELTLAVSRIWEQLSEFDRTLRVLRPIFLSDLSDDHILENLPLRLRIFAEGMTNSSAASFEARRAMDIEEYRASLKELLDAVMRLRTGQFDTDGQSGFDRPRANDTDSQNGSDGLGANGTGSQSGSNGSRANDTDGQSNTDGPEADHLNFGDLLEPDILDELNPDLEAFARGITGRPGEGFRTLQSMDRDTYDTELWDLARAVVTVRWSMMGQGPAEDPNAMYLYELLDPDILAQLPENLQAFARGITNSTIADYAAVRAMTRRQYLTALAELGDRVVDIREANDASNQNTDDDAAALNLAEENRARRPDRTRGQGPPMRSAGGGGGRPPDGSPSDSSDDQSNGRGGGDGGAGGGGGGGRPPRGPPDYSSGDSAEAFLENLVNSANRLERVAEIPEPANLPRQVLEHIRRRVVLIRNDDPAVNDHDAWYRAYREILRIHYAMRNPRPVEGDPIRSWYDAYRNLADLPRAERLRTPLLEDLAAKALEKLNVEGDERGWKYKKILGAGSFGVARLYVKTDAQNNIIDRVVLKFMTQGSADAVQEINNCRAIKTFKIRYCVDVRGDNTIAGFQRLGRPVSTQYCIFFEYCPYGTLSDLITQWARM
ncbi:hypothetical protein BU16DRAFT_60221 [Lophium mytilinum]|uniref:Protein kinase domain-containing protein n=1 Tax=Lophium mytilinum TaxID=390894 RepID=A0A6A6QNJ8_9PEZI|nr:hypothetical protein BU16DRAFT_60221 [Lophium mytilinum]